MKYLVIAFILAFIISCTSSTESTNYNNVEGKLIETGEASWYGPNFHGKQTANGEIFNQNELTAAHRTLPFNSIVKVVNKDNGKSVIVRINDRGPYAKNRIIDLSKRAAEEINMINSGHAKVEIFLLSKTQLPQNLKTPHYTVQVGSFKSKQDAKKVADEIDDSRIVEAYVDGKKYYRIYVGLFKNKKDAIEQKKSLQNEGINCFVKQLQN